MTEFREQPSNDELPSALQVLKLLADDTRWRLLSELRRSDYQVGELVERLGQPQNLVSYHLGLLRQAGLVQAHRSDADARAFYYGINWNLLLAFYNQIGAELLVPSATTNTMHEPQTVVFLCNGNSARSQMAEGWLRHLSGGRVLARSAGLRPQGLHPFSVQVMAEAGVDIGYQHSKGIDALSGTQVDLVVTVCDLAREKCPTWSPNVPQIHWSIPDPATAEGDTDTVLAAFRQARDTVRQRVAALLLLLPITMTQVSQSAT